jgi:hypothetical protein
VTSNFSLQQGEDVLVFNEAQVECRKILSLIPVYNGSEDDTATIKFKVDDEIKHTVHIHEIPTQKSQGLSQSLKSTGSANSSINDSSFRTAPESMGSSSSSSDFTDESAVMQGKYSKSNIHNLSYKMKVIRYLFETVLVKHSENLLNFKHIS